jgi:hypothetical protein
VPAETGIGVGAQERDLVDKLVGYPADDSVESGQGVLELAFLEVDAREAISRVVAYALVDGTFEDRGDRTPRAVMHTVVELEIADGEFGFAETVVQRIEHGLIDGAMLPELGVEPFERFEKVALLGVVQGFAKVPIARPLQTLDGGRYRVVSRWARRCCDGGESARE